jgi:hypothetical protein
MISIGWLDRLFGHMRRVGNSVSTPLPMEPKYCRDCRYCNFDIDPIARGITDPVIRLECASCTHPKGMVMDDVSYHNFLVSGIPRGVEPRYKPCVVMRQFTCGEAAILFEPNAAEA